MRRWLEPLTQDLGYAVRSFRRSPAFLLVALLSLTLGIGATSAIFSVIYGVLIAPYPYAKPGEIWSPEVRGLDGRGGHGYSPDEIRAMAALPAFSDVMATSVETVLMTGEFAPESFDLFLAKSVVHHLLIDDVMPLIYRFLAPGGRGAVIEPQGNPVLDFAREHLPYPGKVAEGEHGTDEFFTPATVQQIIRGRIVS